MTEKQIKRLEQLKSIEKEEKRRNKYIKENHLDDHFYSLCECYNVDFESKENKEKLFEFLKNNDLISAFADYDIPNEIEKEHDDFNDFEF